MNWSLIKTAQQLILESRLILIGMHILNSLVFLPPTILVVKFDSWPSSSCFPPQSEIWQNTEEITKSQILDQQLTKVWAFHVWKIFSIMNLWPQFSSYKNMKINIRSVKCKLINRLCPYEVEVRRKSKIMDFVETWLDWPTHESNWPCTSFLLWAYTIGRDSPP